MATMTPTPTGYYITGVTLPSGTTYELVDEKAREQITTMSSYTAFLGVVSTATPIEDGSTTAAIQIGSNTNTVTPVTGNIVIQTVTSTTGQIAQEFIFDGSKWQLFGDISAKNLGALAYKSSGTYSQLSSINSGSKTVTASGSFTPAGAVTLSKDKVTLAISSTTTDPGAGNTANYWIYQPEGTVSVTYSTVGASSSVIKTITAKQVVLSVTTAAPTSSAVTNGLNYTSVSDHKLLLSYLVVPTDTAVTSTTTKAYTGTTTKQSTTCNFTGTKIYAPPLSVTVATAASFTGTAGSVTVNSGTNKFLTSVTATTASASVSFS